MEAATAAPDDRPGAGLGRGRHPGAARATPSAAGSAPSACLTRALDLVKYASDASPYLYMPQAVVMAREAGDVAKAIGHCREAGLPLTFRAGGTSLNGQAQSEGVLVDVRRHFGGIEVLDGGERVRVRPGTVLGDVNRVLAPHGRRLGPDPASTDIATVGGVIANNSGGMRCGTTADSYSTVRSLTFTLPTGETIDTASPEAGERFRAAAPELDAGLAAIRDELRADAELARAGPQQVRDQEHDRLPPLRLPRRRRAGRDLPAPADRLRGDARVRLRGGLRDRAAAADDDPELGPLPRDRRGDRARSPSWSPPAPRAVELMVAPALMVASHNIPGTPESWRELPPESAALLIEFGGADDAALDAAEAAAAEVLAGHETSARPSSPASRSGSSSTGACARACTGSSGGCGRRGRR